MNKPPKRPFWTSEKLLSASAILISLCTLVVFTYQTVLIRKQQYLSVYPHLNLSNEGTGSSNYKFVIKNEGIGPAFVKEINLEAPSGKQYDDVIDFVNDHVMDEDSIWYFYSNLYSGKLIQPGEKIYLIQMLSEAETNQYDIPPNTKEGAQKLVTLLNHDSLTLEVVYESIYEERWTASVHSEIPQKH